MFRKYSQDEAQALVKALKGKGYKETESAMLHLLKLHHIYNKEEKVHEESDH